MDTIFHYPPELLQLLINTIPLLCRSKTDTLLFFKGAGVGDRFTKDLREKVQQDKQSIMKCDIVRSVLTRLNEKGEATLRERREVLKRVVEFEEFSTCWPDDQLKAKGLVAEVRRVVNVKDSFTRMNIEREKEQEFRRKKLREEQEALQKKKSQVGAIRQDLANLFGEPNPQKRGKSLESVLNELFKVQDILVREAFVLRGEQGEGAIEQIDGVVELDGNVYLVEMKWWTSPIGRAEVSQSLVNVYHRGQSRGIFISASGYTEAAIAVCKEALQRTVVALCKLQEIVLLLERECDLRDFLKKKIHCAIIDKNPLYEPLTADTGRH